MNENVDFKAYYEDSINEMLDHIQFINVENKTLQVIREANQGNWKIVELCREIIFENVRSVEFYFKGIENDREAIKKLI